MPKYKVLIPLLNSQIITFDTPTWYLSENIYVTTISDSDYGAMWRYLDEQENDPYRSFFNPNSKCIAVTEVNHEDEFVTLCDQIRNKVILLQTVFNLFSDGNPVVLSFAAIAQFDSELSSIDAPEKIRIISILDLEPVANMQYWKGKTYQVKPTATPERTNQLLRVLNEVGSRNPGIYFTLSRFNSCLTRTLDIDRIIDLTITLESLIKESNELSFKFSTYLSSIVGRTPEQRLEAFTVFKLLYDARSKIVHGTPEDRKVQKVMEQWDLIFMFTKEILIYYLSYLYFEIHGTVTVKWKEHLQLLMLGVESRVLD